MSKIFMLLSQFLLIQSNIIKIPQTPIKLNALHQDHLKGAYEVVPHTKPYQAFIVCENQNFIRYCGGVLITHSYVLTAAHCLIHIDIITVILGAHKWTINETTQISMNINRKDVKVHEDFNLKAIRNDIGILKLPRKVLGNNQNVQPIQLPKSSSKKGDNYENCTATTSGWGVTKFPIENNSKNPFLYGQLRQLLSDILLAIDVKLISIEECSRILERPLDKTKLLCSNGNDVCFGDSGGPLVLNGVLIGLVSFVDEYCSVNSSSGYTRIDAFLDWIVENTDYKMI